MRTKHKHIAYSLAALIILTSNLAYILNVPDSNYFFQNNPSMKMDMAFDSLISITIVIVLMIYNTLSGSRSRKSSKIQYKNKSIIKIYLNKINQDTNFIAFSLMLPLFIYSILSIYINLPNISFISIFSFILFSVLFINKWVTEYRIIHGYFGNNYHETNKLINFIIKETKNIDFTDRGKPKQLLNNEDLLSLKEDYNNIYGGVLLSE